MGGCDYSVDCVHPGHDSDSCESERVSVCRVASESYFPGLAPFHSIPRSRFPPPANAIKSVTTDISCKLSSARERPSPCPAPALLSLCFVSRASCRRCHSPHAWFLAAFEIGWRTNRGGKRRYLSFFSGAGGVGKSLSLGLQGFSFAFFWTGSGTAAQVEGG